MTLHLAVTGALLRAVAGPVPARKADAQRRITDLAAPELARRAADYGVTTPLRMAHLLAQLAHESDAFCTTTEYWGPTLAQQRYEGRADLGNTVRGDGWRFRGRGLLQLTGRANYRAHGPRLDLPLEREPDLAADPAVSVRIALEYWRGRNLAAPADADDVRTLTRRVNGGLNGIEDRIRLLGRAKQQLAAAHAAPAPAAMPDGLISLGDEGPLVERWQAALKAAGFPLTADGDFGPRTRDATRLFQARAGLVVDGVVGPRSWAALPAGI